MKTSEIKNDPIAEKIIKAIAFIKNKPLIILSIILGLAIIVFLISSKYENDKKIAEEAKVESDKVMLELVNTGLNDPLYFNSTLKDKIQNLNNLYPDSDHVLYLSFILNNKDSIDAIEIIERIKKHITNDWFKTQAYLISGDYFSNSLDYDLALNDYKSALKYSTSMERKAYSNYKIANVYYAEKNYEKALNFYTASQNIIESINVSSNNGSILRNPQFSAWSDRNSIALSKVKGLLKK